MELPDKLYYSISEVSKYFDAAPSLLRYWESEFTTIKPKRNAKGTRFYTRKDIEHIRQVHRLVKEQGYTLQGAKEQLRNRRSHLDQELILLDRLQAVRAKLVALKNQLD